MQRYIGLTIGPIGDTLSLADRPAELWVCSYLFSYIMKSIAKKLCCDGKLPLEHFLVPYIDNKKLGMSEGKLHYGFFHDRMIIRSDALEANALEKVIREVKAEIAMEIAPHDMQALEFVNNYIQVYYAEIQAGENPINKVNKVLDNLELRKSYNHKEIKNYISRLFRSEDRRGNQSINSVIKTGFLIKDASGCFEKSQLSKKKKDSTDEASDIRDIDDIAIGTTIKENNKKRDRYFAIVQADGDNMGKLLTLFEKKPEEMARFYGEHFSLDIKGHEVIRNFSGKCFEYAQKATELVNQYDGVTIYAGGDDLLFLAAFENDKKTVLELCSEISTLFNNVFEAEIEYTKRYNHEKGEESCAPSISFGVNIASSKYPLYEARQRASELLYIAKDEDRGKNSIAIEVQKTSGQKFGLVIKNSSKLINEICQLIKKFNSDEDFLKSVLWKIKNFEELFKVAIEKEDGDNKIIHTLFKNHVYDETHKKDLDKYIEEIAGLFQNIVLKSDEIFCIPYENRNEYRYSGDGEKKQEEGKNRAISVMTSILRLLKFRYEKAGERNE